MTQPILLVHGAFHTGECWNAFEPHLAGRGFEVHTLTLGGHRGNPRDPLTVTLDTYAEDVIARAEAIGRPSVLLGHSMGGLVISGAAERRPELFASLVYVTAFALRFGENQYGDMPPTTELLTSGTRMGEAGTVTIDPEIARQAFYHRCTPQAQAFGLEHLCPQPMGLFGNVLTVTEGRLGAVPRYYVECTDDRALPIDSQRKIQTHMPFIAVRTLDSDHSPFLSQPEDLADAVAEMVLG